MKPKRTVERPWATKRKGGYVFKLDDLIESLKKGDIAEYGKIIVGTKNLIQLLRLLPADYCQVNANGRLEIETLQMVMRKDKTGIRKAGYIKPKHNYNMLALCDGAWVDKFKLPGKTVVALKPKKF